jgi:membrane protease YdiL (CAAX protease family)
MPGCARILQRHSLPLYFLLTLGLTWLLWVPAAVLLFPEGSEAASAFSMPVVVIQTLGAALPSLVALVLVRFLDGKQQLRELFGRVQIWRGDKRWYAIAILLAPLLAACSIGIRAWLDEDFVVAATSPLGEIAAAIGVVGLLLTLPLMFVGLVFSSPILEEFGWRGYALPKLQRRFNALASGSILGLATALWQAPLVLAGGESLPPLLLGAVGTSILMTWIFNSTGGNLLMAILFHGSLAVALTVLNPGGQDLVLPGLTLVVASLVILRYGTRDLAQQPRFQWPDEQAVHDDPPPDGRQPRVRTSPTS